MTDNSASHTVAGRYELQQELGSGGMASVYRAIERPSGREVALKQLRVEPSSRQAGHVVALFEREFHTLTQLTHPCVITVYDYGISERGPYYTMELLDGGDLRERAPLPWQQVCVLFYDVCSSLALLHSRRLVHRDITPRNVRCTRDGRAKLIDFGAMAAIGVGGVQVVGTPAFTAPETVYRLALDARTDLFSLGATLYAALTGQLAYPGAAFAEVMAAWSQKPLAPSLLAPGIPEALDDLVLSLLNVEPALRPASAFEVMQRLAAIGGLRRDESHAVSAAYLTTPSLVGRDESLRGARAVLEAALHHRGGAALVRGAPGLGRSRLLDACALEAKTLGFNVLRATATGDVAVLSVARALLEHLLSALPGGSVFDANPEVFEVCVAPSEGGAGAGAGQRHKVRSLSDAGSSAEDAERAQQAICRALLDASKIEPLVVAVDDVDRIDPQSAAVLAALIDRAGRAQLSVLLTAEAEGEDPSLVLSVLARRCQTLELARLTAEQTRALLSSVFGEVEYLDNLAGELHAIALGSPSDTMELAQHLVDRGLVTYSAGSWRLPSALVASDLPASTEEALRAQLGGLSRLARELAEAQALAYNDVFDQEAYRQLRPAGDAPSEADHALNELLRLGIVIPAGQCYVLSNRMWAAALLAPLDAAACRAHHRALAQLYASGSQSARIYHLFAADDDALGLDEFHARHKSFDNAFDESVIHDPNLPKLLACYGRAIDAAVRLGRPAREQNDLRRWGLALNASVEGTLYKSVGPAWFAQLRHDSGLDVWQQSELTDPGQRLTAALVRAQERYLATPEPERVYSVEESLHRLAEYVVFCIAIGARNIDLPLMASLPAALEPFAPLSPLLDAIRSNALATAEMNCSARIDAALARWRRVLEQLDGLSGSATTHLAAIQNAVAYAIGMLEAQLGIADAAKQAVRLDQDPLQKLSAIQLRKLVALEQGDWVAAERYRRQAELASLQLRSLQMFRALLTIELEVYAAAKDLVGIQHNLKQIELLATRSPIWRLHWVEASGQFELARGDYQAACARFREGLAAWVVRSGSDDPIPQVWVALQAGLADALLAAGQHEEARESATHALAICEERAVGSLSHALSRALALAEGASGDFAGASARLDRVLEQQRAHGASGIWLGLSFEARARVAMWSGDQSSFEHFAGLAATEYRYGTGSPLGARYERLLDEARRRGFQQLTSRVGASGKLELLSLVSSSTDSGSLITRVLSGAVNAQERCLRVLRLLCDMRGVSRGHLFLVDATTSSLGASVGGDAPTPTLLELVDDYLAEQLDDQDATALVDTDQDASTWAGHTSARAEALDYELMLISSQTSGGAHKIAAIAALARQASHVHAAKPHKLLTAIGAQLLAHGDVTGMNVD